MRILSLDGLRGVAVLAVVLFHHGHFRFGWMGVELFFVLSGFLIGGILRRTRSAGDFWQRFYIRRATRILPAVLLLILVVAVLCRPPFSAVLAYVFFLGNFVSYWTPPGSLGGQGRFHIYQLGMLWSLAVEEHFYLFFPFAVRFFQRRTLLWLLSAILVAEPILRRLATHHVSTYIHIYFWTCFHLDGLALGALLALLLEDNRMTALLTRWSAWGAVATLSVFALCTAASPILFERVANAPFFNLVGYSLVSLAAAFAIAYVLLHPQSILSRALASRPLVFVGSISYGLYLCHVGVMTLLRHWTGIEEILPLSLPLAILVSWLSFTFYEKPITAWGHRLTTRTHPLHPPAAPLS